MRKSTVLFAALAAVALAGTAQAQMSPLPISVEVRGGVALPMGDLGDEDQGNADTGWGLGINGKFHFTPMLALYAGYDRVEFGADTDDFEGGEIDANYVDSGFSGGLHASLGVPGMGLSPWVRGGVVYRTLELEVEGDGGVSGGIESDNSLGFQVGGGLAFPLGPSISVTPGLMYTSYSPDFGDEDDDGDVSHLTLDVGLSIRF